VCFKCNKKGHKSPDCPSRPKGNRRVQLPERKPVALSSEELFGSVGEGSMSITIDTGAQVSVIPIECVREDQLVGRKQMVKSFQGSQVEGEACIVKFVLGGRTFEREAIAVEGSLINWTPCFQVPLSPRADLDFLMELAEQKNTTGEEQMYIPPRMFEGTLQTGYMVSEHEGVDKNDRTDTPEADIVTNTPEVDGRKSIKIVEREHVPETIESVMEDLGKIEVNDGSRSSSICDAVLGDHGSTVGGIREDEASVLGEEVGVALGGSAEMGLDVNGIKEKLPKTALVEATANDKSLQLIKQLAESELQGYRYDHGLVLRDRLDERGENITQVCVPSPFRKKCLSLVHSSFGHQGRNKMMALMKPYFYWPRMARDCIEHIKGCSTCQAFDKSNPPKGRMQMREIVSTPFERVAVDLVGPFPTATGGFRFLLTIIDLATRWPEAIPLRTTTSKVVERELSKVFSRCGFPATVITDNGPQFVSKCFEKWLSSKGIEHVKASPYHPQGNGVVERLHRTLN